MFSPRHDDDQLRWMDTHSGYTNDELRDCVLQLNSINCAPPDKNLMAVKNKELFHEVAKIPPLDTVGLSDAYYSA